MGSVPIFALVASAPALPLLILVCRKIPTVCEIWTTVSSCLLI